MVGPTDRDDLPIMRPVYALHKNITLLEVLKQYIYLGNVSVWSCMASK